MNFNKLVKENGNAIFLVVLFVVLFGKMSGISGIGTDAQNTLASGTTVLSSILDWIELIILIGVFVYFMRQTGSKKGGFGA